MSARPANACGIEIDSTRPASISTNSITRAGVACGSTQLVAQEVSIHTHHTPMNSSMVCSEAEDGEVVEQGVRELRDREHEHEVEEQLDEGDAAGLVRGAAAQEASAVTEWHAAVLVGAIGASPSHESACGANEVKAVIRPSAPDGHHARASKAPGGLIT